MRPRLVMLMVLALVAVGLGAVEEASASFSGGSRLVYYFRQTSFAGPGNALTLFTVINNSPAPVDVRFVIFNGQDCLTAGPFNRTLAAGESRLLDVANFASPGTFPSGVIDMYAINGAGQLIRQDQLTGNSLVADLGGGAVGFTTVPAFKLFSDTRSGDGTPIVDLGNLTRSAPLIVTAPILPQTPVLMEDTVVLFSPSQNAGAIPPPSTGDSKFTLSSIPSAGGSGSTVTAERTCVLEGTMAGIFGSNGLGPGRVQASGGGGVGLIGWKFFRFRQGTISLLAGELMQSWGVPTNQSSNP